VRVAPRSLQRQPGLQLAAARRAQIGPVERRASRWQGRKGCASIGEHHGLRWPHGVERATPPRRPQPLLSIRSPPKAKRLCKRCLGVGVTGAGAKQQCTTAQSDGISAGSGHQRRYPGSGSLVKAAAGRLEGRLRVVERDPAARFTFTRRKSKASESPDQSKATVVGRWPTSSGTITSCSSRRACSIRAIQVGIRGSPHLADRPRPAGQKFCCS